jgi:hypothetical protein
LLGHFFAFWQLVGFIFGLVALFALIDCLIRPSAAFVAANKLTKPIWAAILGVCALVLVALSTFSSFFGIPALVGVLVYLLDVRPAVR